MGVTSGDYSIQYLGEMVTIAMKNEILKTIYGKHIYTLADLGL
jgi:hypothetical protein